MRFTVSILQYKNKMCAHNKYILYNNESNKGENGECDDRKRIIEKITEPDLRVKNNIIKLVAIKLKGTQSWNFFILFLQKPKPNGPKGLLHEIFWNPFRFQQDIWLLNISAYAQPAMKSIPRMLSQPWNSFRVCSAWMYIHVKTVHILPLAEHVRKFIPHMLSVW
jgi:hypothetical protein